MRWFRVVTAVAVLVLMARAADARIPSYARQTGFTCNQCHMTWTPTPDFTVTGEKFRMNAYRDPFTADKMEAGEEGAINGKRLVLGLQSYWTWHYRSPLLQQSKSPSDPALLEPKASAIQSQEFGTVGIDYAGPIGEHFGIWTEYYIDAAGAVSNVRGDWTNAEYTVAFATNPGGPANIIGVVWTNQEVPNDMGFSPFRSTAPSHWFSNVPQSGRIMPNSRLMAYAFLKDRYLFGMGVSTGVDNIDYKRFNYAGYAGYAFGNTDDNQLWGLVFWLAGNDNMPLVSSSRYSNTNPPSYVPVETVRGVSATRVSNTPYASVNTGDFYRVEPEIRYGWVDHGHHSLTSSASVILEQDKYDDGAKTVNRGWGVAVRYAYDRTIGVNVNVSRAFKFEFTDQSGVVHDIPDDYHWGIQPFYRVAMNAALELGVNNTQSFVLDQNWRNGWAWSLQWHFLF